MNSQAADLTSLLATQLAISTAMVLLTVTIHGVGLAVLGRAVAGEQLEERERHLPPLSLRGIGFTLATILSLFVIHGLEIWAYTVMYLLVGALDRLEGALYFSTISYAAIGYSDLHIATQWRMLGAIEGINGVLLLGWSTAFFVNLLARVRH